MSGHLYGIYKMPEGKAKGRPRERGVRHPCAECRDGVVEPESVAPAQQVRCDSAKGMARALSVVALPPG